MRSNSELKILNAEGADQRVRQEQNSPESLRVSLRNKVIAAVCAMDSFDLNAMLAHSERLARQKKEAISAIVKL